MGKLAVRVGSRARIITSLRDGRFACQRLQPCASWAQRIPSNGDCGLSALNRREWSNRKLGGECVVKFQLACVTLDRFRGLVARYLLRDCARNCNSPRACGTMLLVLLADVSLWAA
jgi:hypothetical protein